MKYRSFIFLLFAGAVCADPIAAPRVVIEQRCPSLEAALSRSIRGGLRAGEPVSLRLSSDPQEPPKPAVFLGQMLIPGSKKSIYVFHDVEGATYYFAYPEAVKFSRDGRPVKNPGAKTRFLDILLQKGPTCTAHGIINCIYQHRLVEGGQIPAGIVRNRAKLIEAARQAIYEQPDGNYVRGTEGVFRSKQVPFSWGLSDQPADVERLWRHLRAGRPAILEFADLSTGLLPVLTDPFTFQPPSVIQSGSEASPAAISTGTSHTVLALTAFESEGQRFIFVQDSNSAALRLLRWEQLRDCPPNSPIRFAMAGTVDKPATPNAMAKMLESRFGNKPAADFVRAHAKEFRKDELSSLKPSADHVLIRRHRPYTSNLAPEVIVGKVVETPPGLPPGTIAVIATGRSQVELVAPLTIADVYRIPAK